jgi:Holliday junction resolvase RusA-like endonuclease
VSDLLFPVDRAPEVRPREGSYLVRIPRAPVPAARGRCGCRAGHGIAYPDPDYDAWKAAAVQLIAYHWRAQPPIVVPVVVAVEAVHLRPPRPKPWTLDGKRYPYPWAWTNDRRPMIGTADLDNLWKAALDAIVQAGMLADDRLVVADGGSRKVYGAPGEAPCVEVRMWSA